jgi:hypothetical protein
MIIPTKSERMIRLLLDRKATDDADARASWCWGQTGVTNRPR